MIVSHEIDRGFRPNLGVSDIVSAEPFLRMMGVFAFCRGMWSDDPRTTNLYSWERPGGLVRTSALDLL